MMQGSGCVSLYPFLAFWVLSVVLQLPCAKGGSQKSSAKVSMFHAGAISWMLGPLEALLSGLQARDYENVPAPAVTMYSFGQPRVGNLPFSTDYGACMPCLCPLS